MKNFILTALLIILLTSITKSEEEVPQKVEKQLKQALLNKNALGKYFVIAIPPNDLPNNGLQLLALFVAASEETTVRVSTPDGLIGQYLIPKLKVKNISTANDLNWSMMLNDNDEEQVTNKGIILESDKPISVYVINSKLFTSEGYMAIPVNAWGNEYIHCSYFDFKEFGSWKGGLTVLASEDRTKIKLELKGRGEGLKTLRGKSLGATINKVLNKGQTYMIQGTGQTRGSFDLTGTVVTGDKPIAIISSHERCMIPPFTVTNGRDNLIAMPPPVQTWGKNYVTIELDRSTDKGDYFRVVAAEDDTYFDVRWYHMKTGDYLGRWDGHLLKKGDFLDYHGASAEAPHDIESIRGISYFKSDKPIFVMQYSYSANWDKTPKGNYDPFMFPVSLVEQFTKATIFQTPSNTTGDNEYLDNYLNLVVYADAETELERGELLKTLKMDNIPIATTNPELLGQKFPPLGSPYDDKLYWVVMNPQIGPHTLEGDVSFGGYIYGFANFDSYGWPAATAYRKLGELDTLPPVLEIIEDCGYFEIRATEFRDQDVPDGCDTCRPQVDQGMSQLPTVLNIDNFNEAKINYVKEEDKSATNPWYGTPIDYDLNFIYEVIDKKKDGFVHFILPDNTFENFADTTIYYYADKLRLEDVVDFGLKRIYTTNELKVKLISDKQTETTIKTMSFKNQNGAFYKVLDPVGEIIIPAKGEVELTLQYIPKREYLDAENYVDGRYDLDSLIIETECIEFSFPVKGQGGEPYMYVSDWTNPTTNINTKLMSSVGATDKVFIQNYNREKQRMATFPLEVTGIELGNITDETGAAIIIDPYDNANDILVDANNDFAVKYILSHTDIDKRVGINRAEFYSTSTGEFTRNIPFKSNAVNYLIPGGDKGDDTTSTWKTTVLQSNSNITSEEWLKERLLRTAKNTKAQFNNGTIIVSNTSDIDDSKNELILVDLYIVPGSTGTDKLKSSNGEFIIDIDPTATGNNWLQRIIDGNEGNLKLNPKNTSGKASEVALPIKFIPQSDYAANSNIVEESIFAVLKNNSSGSYTTLEGKLTGEVYLPIIDTKGDEETDPVLLNTLAPFQLELLIENVGYNYPLTIWNISAPDNADFTFDNVVSGDPLPTDATPWVIPIGESKKLLYNFTPTAVGQRIGKINITHSGNITGIEPTEDGPATRQIAIDSLIAYGRSTGFEVTNLNLNAPVKCDDDNGIITVSNYGSEPVTITSITSGGQDLGTIDEFKFKFNGNDISTFVGEVIESNGTRDIEVIFIAKNLPAGTFSSTKIIDIEGTNVSLEPQKATSTIVGTTDENTVLFTMNDNINVRDLDPNLILNDGAFNLGVSVELDKVNPDWVAANITEVTFSIRYKLNWLQPVYKAGTNNTIQDIILKAGNAAQDWNFNVISKELDVSDPNLEWEILTIKGNGNSIKNNGVLVYPYFAVKLPSLTADESKLEEIIPEMMDISFGDRDFCIYNVPDSGYVNVQACAAIARTIPITLGQFENKINQTASSIDMNYAVPYNCDAKIEIIDVNGNVVSIPVSENKGMGYYNTSVPLSKLSSGAHIIRYTAGSLVKTDKIVIVK